MGATSSSRLGVEVLAALVVGEEGVEIEGDRTLLEQLRAMVVLPERLRDEARALVRTGALPIAATAAAG